ncbi:hypothetical protein [Microbulbifer pacificus]|uniref:HEAT repeat domain-containing protein n=1 Tax=Microbulbifer pacificus TaxID=407164 RepID=A0AAU0MZ63_9GAMM|nr:hypothetical protein [Microbulbifer pacificus]WOX05308.1 hypothetical protein R5R33_16405 [Microbulbifer pacificus]
MKYLLSLLLVAAVSVLLLAVDAEKTPTALSANAKPQPPKPDASVATHREPTAEQLAPDAPKIQSEHLDDQRLQERQSLRREILELANCQQTYSCPQDDSDPRASDILAGKMLAEKLRAYADFHQNNDYFDEESSEMVRDFVDHSDGFVQEVAIDLMSMQAPNRENALALIESLQSSYDAKIVNQAMKELQRYPELQSQIDQMLAQSLQTGSLYVAQEVALNILPLLNSENVRTFEDVAMKLPQHSLRAKALKSNIREFRLRESGG